jgi:hypothetical protein
VPDENKSILGRLAETFSLEPPDQPPLEGITFEQRAALIGALLELSERRNRSLFEWSSDLKRTLSYAEAVRPLADAINPVEYESLEAENASDIAAQTAEKRLSNIARIGLRLAETHPIAAFGGDVRHLLAESVEGALAKSRPFRLARFLLPTLLALLFGGLIWGAFQVKGLVNMVQEAKHEIETKRAEVAQSASDAKTSIATASGSAKQEITELSLKALESWKAQLQAEAKGQMQDFTSTVEKAKADAGPKINAEMDGIATWGKEQKRTVENAVDAQRVAIGQLAPSIEQAKAAAGPQVQAELDGIREWGKTKRDDIGKVTDGTLAELMQLKNDSLPKIRDALNGLVPVVEQAKVAAGPQVQAELDGIREWGKAKRDDISKTTDSTFVELMQLKNDSLPKIRGQLIDISEWGKEQKRSVESAVDAQRVAIAQLAPAVEQARVGATPQVKAELDGVVEWGREQKNIAGKAVDAQKAAVIQEMADRARDVQGEQTQIKTQLGLLLNDVRNEGSDIQKQLLKTQEQQKDLKTQLEGVSKFAHEAVQLKELIQREGNNNAFTLATLMRFLEWKDLITGSALFLSLLAFIAAFRAWMIARRHPAMGKNPAQ